MSTADKKRVNIETPVYGSTAMASPAPTDTIPMEPTSPEIAYQMVKDETYPQTQPRLNLATFVTTYMDPYATKLMNEAIDMNYIDETEYPRVAVMTGRCINIVANLWHSGKSAVEGRCTGDRFFRGLYAGRCGRVAALARKT